MGAYGASASNAGGPVANIFAGPLGRGGALLRRHKGFELFGSKVYYMQEFYDQDTNKFEKLCFEMFVDKHKY